jgi:hypothetical protein
MQSTDRGEFETHLGAMFGAWNRVLSADAKQGYWKGCLHMTLADFVRCTTRAIESYTSDSSLRLPDVGGLWALKRGLRAPAPTQSKRYDWGGDLWDQKANLHLLTYVLERPKRYSDGDVKSERTRACTAALVAAKNEWSKIMREAGEVELADQGEVWNNCMAIAERAVDALS